MVNSQELLGALSNALKGPLPGTAAHQKMVNYDRPSVEEALRRRDGAKQSAVLVLLYPKMDLLHTILMLRTPYEGVHGSQVSFPGGKREPEDPDLLRTALRETNEEIGIETGSFEILGQLSEIYIPPSKFLVTPYVAYSNDPGPFDPDPLEVSEVIEAPLLALLDESNVKEKKIFVQTVQAYINARYFDVNGHVVWGATAMIISELKEVLNRL